MKLSEMRALLEARGIRLTKSLGQNFLHDRNQLQKIVRAAELSAGDRVLEIGPGLGPLTELLLGTGATVRAIELDRRLVEFLRERWGGEGRLELVHADALDCLQEGGDDWSGWSLVSNLPYSVASPILVELALRPQPPARLVATLQLEVARRIMAAPGGADFGPISLYLQLRYEPRDWFKIPAACFFPAPEIDSACVVLVRRAVELLPAGRVASFQRLVKLAFSERRKVMAKLLRKHWPDEQVRAALARVGIPLETRAERVSLEQFVALTGQLDFDPACKHDSG